MPATPMHTRANVIPSLRYRDAPGAIEWLCQAFGFKKHLVVPGENGAILHAQLAFGNGMIMLGSASVENEYGKLVAPPADFHAAQTQAIYMVVDDADAAYASAKSAAAEIVFEIQDQDYGGRGFTCRDLEGHIWSFGTYDPFA